MKRIACWLLAGLALLSLCGHGPRTARAAEATSAPMATLAPTPTPGFTPTLEPTPTPEPTPMPEPTPVPRPVVEIVEEMAVRYARDGAQAGDRIEALLAEMAAADPDAAQTWARIMDLWRTLDQRTEVRTGVLPDGLPDTNELCIVTLGYSLNADGTMKAQLKSRLKVALKSAKKYPRAYVLCTGGGTASRKKSATEAGQMSAWLKKQKVSKQRILTEKQSRTTAQNARYTLALLQKEHPEVKYVALISGDYHLRVGALFFEAEAILRAEPGAEPAVTVVACAGCRTSKKRLSPYFEAGGLIELAGNGDAAHRLYYNTYDLDRWPAVP